MKKKKKVLPLSKKQLSEQINCWHGFVLNHETFAKRLVKDTKMCSIILSNAKVFGRFYTEDYNFYHEICGHEIDGSYQYGVYYCSWDCLGSGPGSFANEVRLRVTHLSQFLVLLAAFVAKSKR